MIILHDQSSSDLSHIQAIAEISEGFALFDYVRVEQQDKRAWIGQIVEANRNISIVGERLDPTILHGLNLMQLHKDVQSVQSVQVFDILILGQYDDADGQLLTPRLRPLPGSVVAKLNSQHTSSILELPACQDRTDGSTNAIGVLLNVDDVPLCVDARKFNYHVMVAGGTGSGKSNVAANLVTQAARFGKSVLIHDAKPDYGLINKPNSDSRVASLWSRFKAFKLAPSAALEVRRIGFHGRCNPAAVDVVAGFQSNDFNPDALASLFFSAVLETLQYESFAAVASALRQNVSAGNRQSYSLDDILAEVGRRSSGAQNIQAQDRIHELTGQAILRKAGSRRNLYPWL